MEEQLQKIWQQALALMEAELAKPSFDTWLAGTRPLTLQGDTLVVEVANDFTRDWIETRYINLVQKSLATVVGEPWAVRFVTAEQFKESAKTARPTPRPHQPQRSPADDNVTTTMLNPKYTFDSFVIGNSNRFAHAAALAVAEAPARAYNPLFIYGGVGLGKTHLMHAIGHYVASLHPFSKVVYVTSERFTNDLINAIRDDRTAEFRNRYRNIDVLLVDDIQFLAGKERTQEEFFHTFNTLYEASKQIVLSSDRPPREILTLEDRLRSRFEWGLITDIQAPDLETRIAILRKKASVEHLELPNEVMLFIAKQIHSNIRELEGALIRVVAYASLTNRQITAEMAQEALKDIVAGGRQKKISIELIQDVVARYFGLRADDLRAKTRTRTVVYPRQVAMYLSRELTDASLPKIGDAFGGRDHTTVIHSYEKIQESIKEDASLNDCLQAIIQQLQAG